MAEVACLHYSAEAARRGASEPRTLRSDCRLGSMRHVFDIYTIIFLALAVFIFLRLRRVLAQRTGRERPPYDPYSARDPIRTNDKVVALPGRTPDAAQKSTEAAEPAERWKDIAEPGSALAAGL